MSRLISLTTDFGHQGPFVGIMKAVMITRAPDAQVIDYTHEIPVHWPPEAGFWLNRGFRDFPPGSIHVAVVDPGVGTERGVLIAKADQHWFVAPDNGLLADVFAHSSESIVWRVSVEKLVAALGLKQPSNTFHGRDVFAPIAGALAADELDLHQVAIETNEWVPSHIEHASIAEQRIQGSVITLDHFGNLITNIPGELLDSLRDPVVEIGGRHYEFSSTYGSVSPGQMLALVNSLGVIEIARAEGHAGDHLGLSRGAPVSVRARETQPRAER